MKKIGIISESRLDECRTPLVPKHIKKLLKSYPKLKIILQPSKMRCYKNNEYENFGAEINNDLNGCDLILGVKEIEPELLIPFKKYIFFSHTSKIQSDNSAAQGTPGMDKKKLLLEILKKKITLIDYENIRDKLSKRYLGFGRFAGIIGCYNSLNLYLKITNQKTMPRACDLNSYEELKYNVKKKNFQKAKIIITGDGRVARGTLEFLRYAEIDEIQSNEFNEYKNSKAVFCNLPTSKYIIHKNKEDFNLQNFIKFPEMYSTILEKYLHYATILISSHYWDPKSPKLFNKNNLINYKKLRVIGDITCDVNGSIPSTIRSSTIKNPYYYLDKKTHKEIINNDEALAIMAVDNLPSELPKDSSTEFGDGIVSEVLPFLLESDDGRIKRATIASDGKFCSSYKYLNNYMNS